MSSGYGYGSVVPQYAGYGGVVPNFGGSFGNIPGLSGTPNNMGGNNYTLRTPPRPTVSPWIAPPLPTYGGGTYGTTPNMPAPTVDPRTSAPSRRQDGGGVVPPQTAPAGTPATGGTPSAGGGGGGGWLSGIINQITGTPFTPMAAPPTTGLNQAQANMVNYQQYLQNLTNSQADTAFKQAVSSLQGAGTSAFSNNQSIADKQNAQNTQDLTSSGLNNSTVGANLRQGVARSQSENDQRVNEGVANQLVALLSSRQIQGPNTGQWAQYLSQMSNAPNYAMYPGLLNGGGNGINYIGQIGPTWSY